MNTEEAKALKEGDLLKNGSDTYVISHVYTDENFIEFCIDKECYDGGYAESYDFRFDSEEMYDWEVVEITTEMATAQVEFKDLISQAEDLIKKANNVSKETGIKRSAVLLSDSNELIQWHSSRC